MDEVRRANRDEEQHVRWETIEGGKSKRHEVGADLTRSPFDESLARDENGNLREDRADVVHGYGEPNPELNYPAAYNRDELMNTDLNPAMEYPRKTTVSFKIIAVVLGLALFGLLIVALFFHWLAPVRRSPERKSSKVMGTASRVVAVQQFASFVSRLNEHR